MTNVQKKSNLQSKIKNKKFGIVIVERKVKTNFDMGN
jgi:hypothetical protein